MARVQHPRLPELVEDVQDSDLAHWLAQGWVAITPAEVDEPAAEDDSIDPPNGEALAGFLPAQPGDTYLPDPAPSDGDQTAQGE